MRRILNDHTRFYELVSFHDLSVAEVPLRHVDRAITEGMIRWFLRDPMAVSTLRDLVAAEDIVGSLGDLDVDVVVNRVVDGLLSKRYALVAHDRTRYAGQGLLTPGADVPVEPPLDPFPDQPGPSNAKPSADVTPPCVWELTTALDGAVDHDGFETSVLHVRAKTVLGQCTVAQGELQVLLPDGTVVARLSVATAGGNVSFDHTTDVLGDDETSRTLRGRLIVGGDVYEGAEDWVIWPKTLTLVAQNQQGTAPVKGFQFRVKQDDDGVVATTDDAGTVVHPLAKPAPFTVDAEPPCVVLQWTRETGRRREARVERRFKAAFHNPAVPGDKKPIEQMVNLATADDGRDKKGHTVKVLVGVDGDAGKAAGARAGQQGDVIHVKVTFGGKSKRNSPLPTVSGLSGATPDPNLMQGTVTLGAQGEPVLLTLELGQAGGDTCDVEIGSTDACADAKLQFINWRTLFYQVTRPDTMATPDTSTMTAALAKVFVKYEKYKDITFAEADTPAAPKGSWFDGADMGLAGRAVNIGDHNKAFFHAKFDDQKNPLGVHLLMCHGQFDGGSPAHSKNILATITSATTVKFPPPAGADVPGFRRKYAWSENVFPNAFQDGDPSVRDVTWRSLAASGPDAGKTGTVPADCIHVNWNTDRNAVTIKLPDDAKAIVDGGGSVELSAKVLYSLGVFLGESVKNLQLIRDNTDVGLMNAVMTHELGHTMNQTIKTVPPGLSAGDHGWQYTARGHQGPHCAFEVDATVFAGTGSLAGVAGHKCVMFGEAGAGAPSEFCEKCEPFVKAEAVASIV